MSEVYNKRSPNAYLCENKSANPNRKYITQRKNPGALGRSWMTRLEISRRAACGQQKMAYNFARCCVVSISKTKGRSHSSRKLGMAAQKSALSSFVWGIPHISSLKFERFNRNGLVQGWICHSWKLIWKADFGGTKNEDYFFKQVCMLQQGMAITKGVKCSWWMFRFAACEGDTSLFLGILTPLPCRNYRTVLANRRDSVELILSSCGGCPI